MAETILLVFEGQDSEPKILNSFQRHYCKGKNEVVVFCYNTEIYQLWANICEEGEDRIDEDISLITILKEREELLLKGGDIKNPFGIPYDKVNEIYLFFDYDGQATKDPDEKISKMLAYFNDSCSVNRGKLFISYPMVEAIRHLEEGVDFKDVVVDAKITGKTSKRHPTGYKSLTGNSRYQDMRNLTEDDWKFINHEHFKKANYIVHDRWELIDYKQVEQLNQEVIFISQRDKFIKPHQLVAVLSGFPFFIFDHYGATAFGDFEEVVAAE